jgi:hypothetical protein
MQSWRQFSRRRRFPPAKGLHFRRQRSLPAATFGRDCISGLKDGSVWRSETARRIKSSAFLVGEPNARSAEKPSRKPRRPAKQRPERPAGQRLVLFRDNRTPKLMQKIHRLTDN